jgi:hypothetical protein
MDARSCHLATIYLLLLLLTACSTKHIVVEPEVLKDVTPETRVTVVHYSPEPFAIWPGRANRPRICIRDVWTGRWINRSDKGVTIKAAMSAHAVRCADSLWRQFFGREVAPELPLQSVPENAAP